MSYYLFDNPKVGLIIAVIVEIVMILSWLIARDKVRWYALLAGPIVAAIFLSLDWLVQTNREELVEITKTVVQATQDEDAQAIIDLLSDDMTMTNGLGKEKVSLTIAWYLSKPLIQSNFIAQLQVRNDDDHNGVTELAVRTIFDPKSSYAMTSYLRTQWRFEFARIDGDGPFQIKNMEMTDLGGQKPARDIFKRQY